MRRAILLFLFLIPSIIYAQNHAQYKNKTNEQLSGLRRGQTNITWDTFINNFFGPLNSVIQRQFKESYIIGYDYPDIKSAISAIGSNIGAITIVDSQAVTQSSAYTIPSNISVFVTDAGFLYLNNQLTINGKFYAGSNQCFKGNIDSVKFAPGSVDYVRPEWFGAKGDSLTDNSMEINSALNAASVSGVGYVFLGSGKFIVNDNIYLGNAREFGGAGVDKTIIYLNNGASVIVGTLPGEAFKGTVLRDMHIEATQIRQSGHIGVILGTETTNPSGTVTDQDRIAFNSKLINVNVRFFDIGIKIEGNYWGSKIRDCTVYENNTGIYYDLDGYSNAGSNIILSNSVISNNIDYGIYAIGTTTDGVYIDIFGVDSEHNGIDYFFKKVTSGEMNVGLYGCHSELPDSSYLVADSVFVYVFGSHFTGLSGVSGDTLTGVILRNSSNVQFFGGRVTASNYVNLFDVENGSNLFINATIFNTGLTGSSNFKGSSVAKFISLYNSGYIGIETSSPNYAIDIDDFGRISNLIVGTAPPPSNKEGSLYIKQGNVGAPDTLMIYINSKWQKFVGTVNN